jgi:uncharacterized DUF497 family protein
MKFGWDDEKAEENFADHGVTFDEAQEVFFDPNAIDIFDSEHSTTAEPRYNIYRDLVSPPSLRCLYRIGGQDHLAYLRAKSRGQVPEIL